MTVCYRNVLKTHLTVQKNNNLKNFGREKCQFLSQLKGFTLKLFLLISQYRLILSIQASLNERLSTY